MRKVYIFILMTLTLLAGCEIKIKPNSDDGDGGQPVEVQRYDRLESRYLTTGDFSALQQMNIDYPMETRTLVEDVLQLGEVNDPDINNKFLRFYQDTVLQTLIADVEVHYASMNDVNKQFRNAFKQLGKLIPGVRVPVVYSQIGALDQSIVIGNGSIGISLDKYLGSDYPLYKKYYTPQQRSMMQRKYIVPDAMGFYILSLYPLDNHDACSQQERDEHVGKVFWVVNKIMGSAVFHGSYIDKANLFMSQKPTPSIDQLFGKEK